MGNIQQIPQAPRLHDVTTNRGGCPLLHCCSSCSSAQLPRPSFWEGGMHGGLHNPSQIDECKSQPRLHNVAANRGAVPCFENSCRLAWQGAKNHENDTPNLFFPPRAPPRAPGRGGLSAAPAADSFSSLNQNTLGRCERAIFSAKFSPKACLRKFRPNEKPSFCLSFRLRRNLPESRFSDFRRF